MNRRLKRLGKEEKGFTLIELLAVIVILGIIAVIAIPLISNIINKSKDDADLATARQVYDAARLYVTSEKNGDFLTAGSINIIGADGLTGKGYLDSAISLPSNKEPLTGGVVKFDAKGTLESVTLESASHTSTKDPISYTATQVIQQKK
ncbi:type II secretion system protein [Paenibacillus zeisoli]|uniref:Type II secretion system protein n=2 Tax=Paenibacillus zeisoli TaxID=2496267 RepID=A0A433XCV5_9BACL|nr:type II secretion system protein [Paenibacillus zeisoli]